MPNTTRSAFRRVPDRTQNIVAAKKVVETVKEEPVEELITISKKEYNRLIEAEKQLQELKQILNK